MDVSNEFIRQAIWGDDLRATHTLKKYVQRVRRKLGDDARDPNWIKTIHGFGYRFTSPTPVALASADG